jgi:MFS superfamily sulfate permease-like transporter
VLGVSIGTLRHQQPGGGDTPGVVAVPAALAGAIISGVPRVMVMLSAQADAFGVGIMIIVGSMLVPPNAATTG